MSEKKEEVLWKTVWGEVVDKAATTKVKEHVVSIVVAVIIWIILVLLISWVATIPVPK